MVYCSCFDMDDDVSNNSRLWTKRMIRKPKRLKQVQIFIAQLKQNIIRINIQIWKLRVLNKVFNEHEQKERLYNLREHKKELTIKLHHKKVDLDSTKNK